jgi:predicted acylesterase/phospholipase RssA
VKPFRKHVALSVDGGGIRGVIVTRALSILEDHLSRPINQIFRLAAGTSTGAIVSAGLGAGLSARQMHALYVDGGEAVFGKSWRTAIWPLLRYRYPREPLEAAIRRHIGDFKMGDFWSAMPRTDVVITAFDLVENRTRFIKPYKEKYRDMEVATAVLASSSVPTYFPVVEGRFVDGGVGSYANPSYLAAYELRFCLGWDPAETTLISLGTGRVPHTVKVGEANRYWAWDWAAPILGAFSQTADDQQVHLVNTFFDKLDFRRFQVDLKENIQMDDTSKIRKLVAYGNTMGRKILTDDVDRDAMLPESCLAPA